MKIHRGNYQSDIEFLSKTRLLKKNHVILEIGSGSGAVTHHLRTRGYHIIGTEIDALAIQLAKEHFDLKLKKMSGDKLLYKERSFDRVLSFDVFEHIPDTHKHLREVSRVLKPGGYYLFATPNKLTNIPFSIINDRHLTRWQSYHGSLHTFWELKRALTIHGFESEFIDIPVVNTFFISKLSQAFGSTIANVVRTLNPDRLPLSLRTNFFVIARKS